MADVTIPDSIITQFIQRSPEWWVKLGVMRGRMQGESIVGHGIDTIAIWDAPAIKIVSRKILPAQIEYEHVKPFLATLPDDWSRLEIFISIDGTVTAKLTQGKLPPANYTERDAFQNALRNQEARLTSLAHHVYGNHQQTQ